jgi:hypothetical protein
MNDDMRELERKSRAAFDASVESLDAATRVRLARARTRALETLARRQLRLPAIWVPAGAAAAALAAFMLWQRADDVTAPHRGVAIMTAEDFDMIAAEDFEMLEEDEGFYAWAEEQVSGGVG